ncbi:MAG: hypothetical protein CVV51_06920 [Spirochaetae bacterium HGW-Spirochaetae-7]|nr:MAG: hypothetical protein CVV51_06920 [Spirochaetae bacterium HGW-Spirochaetae-7]
MVVVAVLLVSTLVACASFSAPTVRAYAGDERPETELSTVQFKGSGFPDIYLYRVDGKPRMELAKNTVAATFSDSASLGFAVYVLPGEHVFEFYNVHKTPFDKKSLDYRSIDFTTEAGKTYFISRKDNSWQVECGGETVPSTVAAIPVLPVPAAGAPQSTLEFKRSGTLIVAYVLRIDGMLSPTMSYFEPRWVAFNSPGVMPPLIRRDLAAIHSPLVDLSYGNLSIAIAPGHHIVEYTTDYLPMAYRCMGDLVRTIEFEAVAGKTYRIVVDKAAEGTSATEKIEYRVDGSTVQIVEE